MEIAQFTSDAGFYCLQLVLLLGMGAIVGAVFGLFLLGMGFGYHMYDIVLAPAILRFKQEVQFQAPQFFSKLASMKNKDFWLKEPKDAEVA